MPVYYWTFLVIGLYIQCHVVLLLLLMVANPLGWRTCHAFWLGHMAFAVVLLFAT
jgi:hypothetical protein